MPSKSVTANVSGALLFQENKHKKANFVGITVDHQSSGTQTIQIYDCFTAISGKWASGGASQSQEDFATNVLSGKIRQQITVQSGQTTVLAEQQLKDVQVLGSAYIVATATATGCVITAQYEMI
ncbi:MAG: hypothetical protein PHQ43_01265 [Dehalococcoidales bacterium]|nr:hypothetical protein [Dehalococcoidales bacterium]